MLQSAIDQLTRGGIISRVFVLHWAQPKSKDIQWTNKRITLPGRDAIGERDVPEYADGSPIPGTVLIADEMGEDSDGNSRMFFDSLKAVHYFLGIQPKKDSKGKVMNGDPKSPLFKAGLSALPYPCTKEQVAATLIISLERVEAFDYESSLRVINEHDQKNAARSARNLEPVGGGKAYHDAVRFKREYEEKQGLKLGIIGDLAEVNPGMDDDELDFLAFARLKVMASAAKVPEATDEMRAKLIDEWLNTPEVRAKLKQQYKLTIRRKGYGEDVGFRDTVSTLPADPSVLLDGAAVPLI